MHATLYFDGGARPTNPGSAGFACLVTLEDGTEHPLSRFMGWATNNEAEYHGLIVGIKYAHELGAESIEIYTDAELLVGHICKGWKRQSENLRYLANEVDDLLNEYFPDSWTLEAVKREDNTICDDLCTKAILAGRAMNPFLKKAAVRLAGGRVIDPFASPSA